MTETSATFWASAINGHTVIELYCICEKIPITSNFCSPLAGERAKALDRREFVL